MNTPEEVQKQIAAPQTNSRTPRTDAECFVNEGDFVTGDFARQLETELAAALAQLAQRQAEVEQLLHINDACIELENQLRDAFEAAARANRHRDDALDQRDAYFSALFDLKETLATIIPALETASGLKAADFHATCPDNGPSLNEWAALWLARSIQEAAQLNPAHA